MCNLAAFLQCPDLWADGGALGVSMGSKVSPSGQGRRATDTTSVAFASSSRNALLPFLALLNSSHTTAARFSTNHGSMIQQWGPSHNSGRPTPAMPQSEYGPTFWELPPPGASYLLLPDRHGTPKAKRDPATPTCASSQGEQVILLCLSFSKCLVRRTKKSLSHALGGLIFCQTEMKNKPNLSCQRITKCLWQFYQSM